MSEVNARDGMERTVTCGGSDAAERDDAFAGDPEVVVREEAAPFAAQTLQPRERERKNTASVSSTDSTARRGERRKEDTPIAVGNPGDLGEGRAVEEHGRERRRHREHRHEPPLRRRRHGSASSPHERVPSLSAAPPRRRDSCASQRLY
jgi:hypothetical protein